MSQYSEMAVWLSQRRRIILQIITHADVCMGNSCVNKAQRRRWAGITRKCPCNRKLKEQKRRNGMKKLITICLVIAAVTGTSFGSVGEGYAIEMFTPYHWIWFLLKNDISSKSVVSSLTVDGSTAVDGPVVWKGVHITQPPLWPENLEWDPESLVTFSATEEGFTGIEPGDAIMIWISSI